MEKILDFLGKLNLSETEAKLYLSLIETGPATVKDIAAKIGLKRTTAYLYIDNLMEKGLISRNIINSRTQISPIDPHNGLTELVTKDAAQAKEVEKKLPEILATIKTAFPEFKETDHFEIKYYKGVSGVKIVYDEALSAKEVRTYVKLSEDDTVFTDNPGMFENAFKKNPNLQIKELLYKSDFAIKEAKQITSKHPHYSYKLVPEDIKLTTEDILIYDGKVAIIHYRGKENCSTVVLQSIDYYNNSKQFFDFIWKMIPQTAS